MYGELEYKTTTFEHKRVDNTNYQGTAVMNYTDLDIPFTRCIEHRHFENTNSEVTWITFEYPTDYKANTAEPMYPVNDTANNKIYRRYKELVDKEKSTIFGGRLAEYKYYDMHQVIESALNTVTRIIC